MAIESKTLTNPRYHDINPTTCGHQICDPHHSFGPAVRDNWLLHFVVSGKGVFRTVRGEYALGGGDLFIIRPQEITYYEADGDDPWEYYWLSFDSSLRLPSAIRGRDYVFAPYLEELFRSAFDRPDSTAGFSGYEDHLCSVIYGIIARLRAEESNARAERAEDYVRSAISIMSSEYPSGITVADVAARLHLNRSYFTSLFTSVTGVSPKEHLRILRMERAAALLRSGQYTVSVVAASVGYSDLFIFSRAFKGYYGVSPTEYRSSYGG